MGKYQTRNFNQKCKNNGRQNHVRSSWDIHSHRYNHYDPHLQKRQKAGIVHTAPVHDDVIKWKHFPRCWPFVREIHRSPVNFPHKGQWRGALMFSLIYAWINDWVNNREAGDLRRQHGHYDVIVMKIMQALGVPRIMYLLSSSGYDADFIKMRRKSSMQQTVERVRKLYQLN